MSRPITAIPNRQRASRHKKFDFQNIIVTHESDFSEATPLKFDRAPTGCSRDGRIAAFRSMPASRSFATNSKAVACDYQTEAKSHVAMDD